MNVMARPTKPKDLKPKADGEAAPSAAPSGGGGGSVGLDIKFLVTIVAIVLSSLIGSAGSIYLASVYLLVPTLENIKVTAVDAEGGGEAHGDRVGMNLELDEFTVNLKEDPNIGGNQYLRAKLSMSIGVPSEEDCYHEVAALLPSLSKNIAGAAAPIQDAREYLAAGAPAAGADTLGMCLDKFKNNMGKYVPTMRDVINAALMKPTAGTLTTLEGQEALKDEIKEEINLFMDDKYEVLRINFEDFVIQR